jgi:hypothetical protein
VRVSNALLARYAEYEEGSDTLTIVGGGVDVFGTPELPI